MRIFLPVILLVALVGFFGASAVLEHRRRELQKEVAELKRRAQTEKSVADRDGRSSPILSVALGSAANVLGSGASPEIQAAQREVATLETRATNRRAEIVAAAARREIAAAGLSTRDPTKGMTSLDHFQNVGRDTPADALQTLVWAALHGDEAMLTAGVTLDDVAQARAVQLAAKLPADSRGEAAPEKLAALWFSSAVLDVAALHVFGEVPLDDTHVTLLVRGGIADQQKLMMRQTPAGWQIVVPARAMEVLQKKVAATPLAPKPP